MKKTFYVMIFVLLLFVTVSSNVYADDWYNIGYSIGQSIGNSPAQDDKSFYKDDKYDFTHIKKICVVSTVPPQCYAYISDPYITQKYTNYISHSFADICNMSSANEAGDVFTALYSDTLKPGSTEFNSAYITYIRKNYDAVLYVNIYAYNQNEGLGNVFMDFRLIDTKTGKDVMYYKDMRLNAPRSDKEGMIQRITNTFRTKFKKAKNNY
ncbi:hypothetical protein NXG27_01095 [Megasphaera paucivorans]|uniref:Uncharacterized protein n=1 Tax=Megasphaera paucivorans TaxID=349095 RepID=A0A1G9QFF8_9FIRM|nr:hypothetical protein [Megasphaera paucivorans]SDM09716.1 hypothetical protein SAMN05660299_00220 [Megasphaera paucivorans]